MRVTIFIAAALAISLAAGSTACGPGIDLATSLAADDVFTGWYDDGVKDGQNHLVPSVSFRLKNIGTSPVTEVQLSISFWRDGADGEWDSKEVRGIGAQPVAPGATSDPILVRAGTGFTSLLPRAEMFSHSLFKDAVAKLFAKRGGKIVRLGEFKIERRVIPPSPTAR